MVLMALGNAREVEHFIIPLAAVFMFSNYNPFQSRSRPNSAAYGLVVAPVIIYSRPAAVMWLALGTSEDPM